MLQGIITIPLPGHPDEAADAYVSRVRPLSEFIAGPENALAATALRPFLERASGTSSPLVLYGPHGAGKSHLAHGLAAWWRQHFPTANVVVLSASELSQNLTAAVHDGQLDALRNRWRAADLFVLEDLGQLTGRRGAQDELVSLLDALADREALVVITARSLPNHSRTLIAALRSRLSAGLAVPLALPGPAVRRSLLERVAAARELTLPKAALMSLADRLHVSLPALVAAALELQLATSQESQAVDSRRVQKFVSEHRAGNVPTLREIAQATAKYFSLKLTDLRSSQRRQSLVAGRGVAMYLARQLTDHSLEQIGAYFGGRDHTTVLHGCRRTEERVRRDAATRQALLDLQRLLRTN